MLTSREYIRLQVEENIAVVRLDRPPVNALNVQLQNELGDAFEEIRTMNHVGAVIITGSGDKAFMAGAEIKMLSEMGQEEALRMSESTQYVFNMIQAFDRVVIAAVNGLALGGGCELALACDMRVADETAVFGFPEVSLGLFPGAGGTQRLTRLVGMGKAKELILTGDPIDAAEAKEIGLVERLVSQGDAVTEARKIAKRILLRGPVAVAKAKEAINEGINMPMKGGLKIEAQLFSELFQTRDHKEGINAFLERRPPRFFGR
ncbi:MAG: enoyl-CoA hydratase/isomerase family protein [Desulfobacteraceae bacterium]|nr:enoyl-CoA hydratase/isomerase family protein [Desulfobacteraceae bacterium]